MPPSPEPVAITGTGVIGAFGCGMIELDSALREGREGVGKLTLWESSLDFPVGQFRGDINGPLDTIENLTPRIRKRLSRSDQLALIAVSEALAKAGLDQASLAKANAGAYIGQSVCGTLDSEAAYIEARERAERGDSKRASPRAAFVHEGANTLDRLAEVFELPGPTLSFMTACSSAANAIGLAADRLRSGESNVMIAGGADSLSRIAFNGFCSLKVVSPDGPRPFDKSRHGMMVGEGGGVLVLESLEHAKARGAKILALLSGYGHSCDAHHLTAPHPEGTGAVRAMREALTMGGIGASDVGYVNAHGTSTLDNDRVEALALNRVFGDKSPPVSSTKRFSGHTLAAAGGIEAAISVWALQNDTLPANLGLQGEAEDGHLDIVRENRNTDGLKFVLSNSFGFGGNNAALLLQRAE